MSITIQNLPTELNILIFLELEFKDLINAMKVCRTWKQIIESRYFLSAIEYDKSTSNLVIDIPRDLFIDKDLSVAGALLIRATNIYNKPGICLSGEKVTLVANRIRYLGPIRAKQFDQYSNNSYIKGSMPGNSSGGALEDYSAKPDFWSSLVSSHRNYTAPP